MSDYQEQEFTLADLIRKEGLILEEALDPGGVIEAILPGEGGLKPPLMIGIDGSVTAGKSYISSKIHEWLVQHGLDCVVIHGDWYMSPRKARAQEVEKAMQATYNIATYDEVACDYEKITAAQTNIFDFFQAGDDSYEFKLSGAYSRESGNLDGTIDIPITSQSVVIFEGTGVINSITSSKFDLAIRVDVGTYDETVRRLYERESQKDVSLRIPEPLVKQRYDHIDYRYDCYLRLRDSQFFDILLDTSDTSLIRMYRRKSAGNVSVEV